MYDDELDSLLSELSGEVSGIEIVGQGMGDISIGARQRNRAALAARMAQARNVDPNAVALVNTGPGPRRVKVLPGPVTTVAAGATVDVTFTAQENFRPERFFIEDAIAPDFQVGSIKVGTEEQFVSSGAAPGSMFTSDSVDSYLHFKTLRPGNDLVVRVTNTSAGPLDFVAAFKGTAVD